MNDGVIPVDARQFLLTSIDSIAQLEGLLWLRIHAGQGWDAATLARHLYVTETDAASLLAPLVARDLVAVEQGYYAYRPATAELDAMVTQIADLYRQYLIPVTNLIHAKPEKPGKSRIEAFADAFRLRKDKP
jgi:hypothetical protein